MGTTLIMVELVIIGFQVLVWVTLLLGLDWIPLAKLKDWIPLVGVLALALAYTLGVVFDRSLGFLSSSLQEQLRKLPTGNLCKCLKLIFPTYTRNPEFKKREMQMKILYIMLNNSEAYRELNKFGSQKILLRATFVNSFLIFLIGYKCWSSLSSSFLLLLVVVSVVSFFTWRWYSGEYAKAVDGLYELARKDKDEEKK